MASSDPAKMAATPPQASVRMGRRAARARATNAAASRPAKIPYSSAKSPRKRANGRRSSTSAIPSAAGLKLSQNGSTSTTLATSTSTSQVIA